MLRRVNLSATSWDLVWSTAQRVLVVNAGLALTNLPLLGALALVAQPWRYPVFFGVLALSLGPSVAAAFGCLDDDGGFVRAYRMMFWRALGRWALVVALVAVLVTDIAVAPAVLVPLLVVTAALVLSAGVLLLALLPLRPELRLWPGVRLAVYASVRRGWLGGLSLVVLLAALAVVNQAPLLGLSTVPGFALIVVWANSRAALSPRD